ncbi:hypothetical protein FOZ60_014866 [Perkinsus olseni]|uniref:Uncharacterized protein n=1 Tax=Perkinsus olseni TaxID=32597 RepID=A0A7J6N7V7_PEROL|nr:hypothetical protein FOZ60_014866 [Perkinsus olseni]
MPADSSAIPAPSRPRRRGVGYRDRRSSTINQPPPPEDQRDEDQTSDHLSWASVTNEEEEREEARARGEVIDGELSQEEDDTDSFAEQVICIEDTMKQVGLKANRLLNKQEETRIGDSLKRMSNMYITLLEENRKLRKSLMKARQAPSSAPGVRPVPGRNAAGVSQIASQLSYRDILTGTIKNDQNAFKDKPVVEKIYPTARGVGIRCDNPSTADTVVGNLSENNIEGARKPALQPEVWIGFTPRDERDFGPIAEAVQAHPSGLQPDKWKVLRSGAKGAAVRVPLEDRDKLIRDGGLYLPGIKFRVKDSPHIRVCFDCGQPHSGPCTATTKACCNCGRNHSLRDCKNHPQLAPDQVSCTLCGKKGHNSLAGVGAVAMCPRKLDLIKVKLSKTGLGPNSPSWSF